MKNKYSKRKFTIIQDVQEREMVKGNVVKEKYQNDFTSFDEPIIDEDNYLVLTYKPEEGQDPNEVVIGICTEEHFMTRTYGLMAIWSIDNFDDFYEKMCDSDTNKERVIAGITNFFVMKEMYEEAAQFKEKLEGREQSI